jgi:hypothetical protein
LKINEESLSAEWTSASHKEYEHEAWEPDWIVERFSCLLRCNNSTCAEIATMCGSTSNTEYQDYESGEHEVVRSYKPKFIMPAPWIFEIPAQCPDKLAITLKSSFAAFWFDNDICANKLRSAIEEMLNERKIARFYTEKGKRNFLSLHTRIKKFKEKAPDAADSLFAIKWLGNFGSHGEGSKLSSDDLLDGFELVEHVIDLIYVKRQERLNQTARLINRRRGRPRPIR